MATAGDSQVRPISVGDHRFVVDGKVTALYGGAVHYWRLERELWSDLLDKVKEMGFTTISIYIPWEAHELSRGEFDFGHIDPRKDIDAFLTLIEEMDLNIVVRPGPQINSELTWFGYPMRILDDPQMHALNGRGTRAVLTQVPRPIPAVSYAVDKFFDETAIWYDAICGILAKHAYPKGRIVAAQVDNEMAFFFHVNAYASDYNPAAIKKYRAFLEEKYGTIDEVNAAYGRDYSTFGGVDPPRRFDASGKEDIPYYSDWITYRERYLIDSMARLADMMRARGLDGIALFHNYPHPLGPGGSVSGFTTPFNLMGLEEKLDFVGFDIYSRKELYEHVKTVVSYVVGTSRFPYVPEFIAGVWPWYLNPGDLGDEEFVTKAGLMHGIKGFSRYMLVERDRWLDSPIRRDGRVREDHRAMFGRVNQVLSERSLVDVRRQADVLLLANRDYDRLEAASVLVSFPGDFLETPSGFSEYPTFMTVSEQALGFAEPIQVAKSDWFTRCYGGLTDSGCAFLLSDTALPPERWKRFKVLVLSSFEYLDASLQHHLVEYARGGGVVVLGPRLPELDAQMQTDETIVMALRTAKNRPLVVDGTAVGSTYQLGEGWIMHLSVLSDPGRALAAALDGFDLVRFTRSDSRLDVAVHGGDEPARRIVFVANPTPERIDAQIGLGSELRKVREVWEDREVAINDGTFSDVLEPYQIKIYECLAPGWEG